ncbi:MAG: hypothetical protein CMG63_00160 [Candidatus Marinimicrobia bacterium]|nr:hypothetical protein [Candidatus Neomarinimicrobiota bacterium]
MVFVSTAQELLPNSPDILFTDWLKIGIPFVVIFLPIAWIYIIKIFNVSGDLQGSSNVILKEYADLGKMSLAERKVLLVVILYALGFIFRDNWSTLLGVNKFVRDSPVAFFAVAALFSLSSGRMNKDGRVERLLEWDDAQDIPWAIAMLIGGGLAIASAFKSSGLVEWIGANLVLNDIPVFLIVVAVVTAMVFLTEINSNTATTAVFLPVLAGVSDAGNFHPYLLMVPATIAASCAFMLPSGTGPNASVLASGQLSIPQMARAGFGLNIVAIIFIFILFYFILFPLMGIV